MTGTSEPGDLYEMLGVPRDAPAAEITRAYHRRARALHPDTHPPGTGQAARFQELQAAYQVLHDPARRAAYDQILRQATARPTPAPRPPATWPWPHSWPATRPPGAALWAGPAQVSPPGGGLAADPAEARLAGLALLLARHLRPAASRDWPW